MGEAESKMRLLGLTTDTEKNSFVQSSAGPELTQFWEKEARIRWVATINPVQAAHTYEDLIRTLRPPSSSTCPGDLKRLALIAGFKDRSLAEKCLGEEYDLKQVMATAITRESSKANAEAVKVQEGGSVKQVLGEEEGMKETLEKLQGDVQTVIKLQQKGKYSGAAKKTCPNCTFEHEKEGKCPAVGRECRRCGHKPLQGQGHQVIYHQEG